MIKSVKLSESVPGPKRCVGVEGIEADIVRLKRMGIFSGAEIELIYAGDPMILKVVGTRVGLSRMLASRIEVEELKTDRTHPSASAR